jgi:hypothetical protein
METTYNPSQQSQVIVTTTEQLQQVFKNFLPLVKTFIKETKQEELMDKLWSQDKACELFEPKLSKPTFSKYERLGYFSRYEIEGRPYYKHSEIMAAAKKIKRYSRQNLVNQ